MLRVNSSKHINGKNSTTTIGKTWPKTETENISKKFQQGFLCCTVDKNPRATAGDKGSTEPWSRSAPHATAEPVGHGYLACALGPAGRHYQVHTP